MRHVQRPSAAWPSLLETELCAAMGHVAFRRLLMKSSGRSSLNTALQENQHLINESCARALRQGIEFSLPEDLGVFQVVSSTEEANPVAGPFLSQPSLGSCLCLSVEGELHRRGHAAFLHGAHESWKHENRWTWP